MDAHQDLDAREARANDLYWDSEESVNDIAERLDLSKGTLYGLIRPRASGLDCPDCGTELEYPNRTAREKGFLTCPSCGLEEEEELLRGAAGVDGTGGGPASSSAALATVFLGAAAGMLLIGWLRRR